jgi:glycosyltransferase involved in cell wall biosynthesis
MNILHLIHQYPPEFVGGSELHTQGIARAQAAQGHAVAVFTRVPGEGAGLEVRQDGPVRVYAAANGVPSPTGRFLATWGDGEIEAQFGQALDEFQPDVVHIQHMMGQPKGIFDRVRAAGLPVYITLLDFWWVCANAQLLTNYSQEICDGPDRWINCARCVIARSGRTAGWAALPALPPLLGWRSRMLQEIMAYADALLAPCPFVRDWYAAHGAPADRTIVVPLGIDSPPPADDKPSPADDKPPARGADEPLRVLYVGGIAWQKGLHVLLEAARGVTGPLELQIAGDLDAESEYGSRLHGLADARVCFLGRLDRAAVWAAMRDAHLIAVPSLWYETYSLLTHEAFAVKRPVFASNLGALTDAVRDGVDGLLLPPGDVNAWRAALQRAVDKPEMLSDLGANARPPATIEEIAARTLGLYLGGKR